ncbi:peroxide stress protein YaaA [Lacticaseibacillus sp. GG6-2]
MQLIIAPAKKMRIDPDSFAPQAYPQYLDQTKQILATLRTLDRDQLQKIWACSDKLATESFRQLQQLRLEQAPLTPAIIAFVGVQYQSMAPDLFTESALQYIQTNLRILSGFYGILRPFDAIVPYRLEMGSRLAVGGAKDLYAFWGSRLHDALDFTQGPVINLASAEYAKAIRPFLQPGERLVDVRFGHLVNGRIKTCATKAKIARGAMVRFLAENNVTTADGIDAFDHPLYHFAPTYSSAEEFVFLTEA